MAVKTRVKRIKIKLGQSVSLFISYAKYNYMGALLTELEFRRIQTWSK